jgi:hypothetical protein
MVMNVGAAPAPWAWPLGLRIWTQRNLPSLRAELHVAAADHSCLEFGFEVGGEAILFVVVAVRERDVEERGSVAEGVAGEEAGLGVDPPDIAAVGDDVVEDPVPVRHLIFVFVWGGFKLGAPAAGP